MNECRDERRWCCFHPKEMVVGICALCLNERLLILAASNQSNVVQHKKRVRLLPNIFALTSLLKQHKSHELHHSPSTSSQEGTHSLSLSLPFLIGSLFSSFCYVHVVHSVHQYLYCILPPFQNCLLICF